MRHKRTYHDMETSRADMTGRPAYSVRHPDGYPDNEYTYTHNTSTAGKLIRVQAEYVARKYGIRG